jgi:hypothetical protein
MALEGQVFNFTLEDSSLVGMLQKINSFTDVGQGGILGIFILMVVGGVLFMMMKAFGSEKSLAVAMFITSIVGLFLRILNLIGDFVFYICIILFVLGIIFMMKDSERYE